MSLPDTVVRVPVSEVINIDSLASVDTLVWWCRLCAHEDMAQTRPLAYSAAVEHLVAEHRVVVETS